ncbi:MAG: cyclase family protein [Deltaproteobacteria bacterium]|nr:cyclase family protein [Deltaproteobacteria bacterium]MBW2044729.1 cyclase family protein [Deltaproteobacteria bacterium]
MKFYDATLPIREGMWTFPLDPPYKSEIFMEAAKGDMYDLALLSFGNHLGTHVDAPKHYSKDGITVDQISLDVLVGPGVVVDMRGKSEIDGKDLEGVVKEKPERIFFKTDNGPWLLKAKSEFPGDPHKDFVHLTDNAAKYLVDLKVRLAGIDYQSIGPETVHHILWDGGVTIMEGANLLDVAEGSYQVWCLPLRIEGADAAPARLVLGK